MDAPIALVKRLLESVVNLHATVPPDDPSAAILGEDRMASATSGLVHEPSRFRGLIAKLQALDVADAEVQGVGVAIVSHEG